MAGVPPLSAGGPPPPPPVRPGVPASSPTSPVAAPPVVAKPFAGIPPKRGEWNFVQDPLLDAFKCNNIQKAILLFKGSREADFSSFPALPTEIFSTLLKTNTTLRKLKLGLGTSIENGYLLGMVLREHPELEVLEVFGLTLQLDKLRENKLPECIFSPMGVSVKNPGMGNSMVNLKDYPQEVVNLLCSLLQDRNAIKKLEFGFINVMDSTPIANLLKTLSVVELRFQGNVGSEGASLLLDAGRNSLTTLRLNSCRINGGEFARQLRGNNTLTLLEISGNEINAAGARVIAEALKDCKLTELNISKNPLGGGGVQALFEQLNNVPSLSTLCVGYCVIDDGKCFEALRGNQTLAKLNIEGMGRAGFAAMVSVLPETKMDELLFSVQDGDPDTVLSFLETAKNSSIQKIRLQGWGPNSSAWIKGLKGNHLLTKLDVGNSRTDLASAKILAKALMGSKIVDLQCINNKITDEGAAIILAAGKDLQELNLSGCEIGGAEFAGMLLHLHSLTKLDLSRNKLTDVGAKAIAAGLVECKSIVDLNLSSNEFGMDGATVILEACKNFPALTSLRFERCAISGTSPRFLSALSELFKGQTLPTYLQLAGNRPEISWVKTLAEMKDLQKVRFAFADISLKELRESPSYDVGANIWSDPLECALILLTLRQNPQLTSLVLKSARVEPVFLIDLLKNNSQSLTTLNLANSMLTAEIVSSFKHAKNLKTLILRTIRAPGLNFEEWLNDSRVIFLDFSGTKLSVETLKALKRNRTIQTLVLDDEMHLPSIRQSTHLDLSKKSYTDEDVIVLSALLEENKNLQSLNLATNCFGDIGMKALLECTQNLPYLTSLNVRSHQGKCDEKGLAEKDIASIVKCLLSHNALSRLDMSAAGQWDNVLVRTLQESKTLTYLDLTGHNIPAKRCRALANAIKANVPLVNLALNEKSLFELQQFRDGEIHHLNVSNQGLSNLDAILITSLLDKCSPSTLDFSRNVIGSTLPTAEATTTDEMRESLKTQFLEFTIELQRHQSVKHLNLSRTFLADIDMPGFSLYLKTASLSSLDLRGNVRDGGISPNGAQVLVDGVVNSQLQKIFLGCELLVANIRQGKIDDLDSLLESKTIESDQKDGDGFGLVDLIIVAGLLPTSVNSASSAPKRVSTSQAMLQYVARTPHDPVGLRKLILHGIFDPAAFNRAAPTRLRPLLEHLQPDTENDAELLRLLVERGVFELKDDQQRSYLNLCTKAVLDLNNEILLFCGRFKCANTHLAEHRSATCMVFRAFDELNKEDVVLKLMKFDDQYRREVDERKDLVGTTGVLEITAKSEDFKDDRWARDTKRVFHGLDYAWGIVMLAAQRNLMIILLQERVDLTAVRRMVTAIVRCIGQMHQSGRIHGDLKPNNIVRMPNEDIRLIDLDATAPFGSPVGAKSSTAYCPPEMTTKIIKDDDDTANHSEDFEFRLPAWDAKTKGLVVPPGKTYELLSASVAFDMWSLGVVLYRSVVHKPLLEADDSDNLRGKRERLHLARWGAHSLEQALADASIVLREENTPHRDRLAVLDLLRWLLQSDPAKRPVSCEAVLAHAFFQPQGIWQISELQYFSALGQTAEVKNLLSKSDERVILGNKPPLHLAAEEGHAETVQILLDDRFAQPDKMDDTGLSALQNVLGLLDSEPDLASQRLQVVKILCARSNLELLTETNPPISTLDLGRRSRNHAVRNLFESEMVLQLLLAALENPLAGSKSDGEFAFRVADCNKIWASKHEVAKQRLQEAIFKMLSVWGLEPSRSGTLEAQTAESEKKQSFVRVCVFPLRMWQTDNQTWQRLRDLAKEKEVCVLAQLCRVRDKMLLEHPEDAKIMTQCSSTVATNPPRTLVRTVAQFILEHRLVDDSEERRRQIDRQVLVPLARTIATNNESTFLGLLKSCLNDPPMDKEGLPADWTIWLSVAPVKGESRIQAKVEEYCNEIEEEKRQSEWPFIEQVRDTLRATVVCRNITAIRFVWEALNRAFRISATGRMKNNLTATNKPQDILLNAVLNESQIVEIQIQHHEILAIKENDLHLLYEILRAQKASDLASKTTD